jgi:hypothetical protein
MESMRVSFASLTLRFRSSPLQDTLDKSSKVFLFNSRDGLRSGYSTGARLKLDIKVSEHSTRGHDSDDQAIEEEASGAQEALLL